MNRWNLALVAALALVLTGCVASSELTRRYASHTEETVKAGDLNVHVSAFVMPPPQGAQSPTNVLSLSDVGQAALIKALAAKEKTGEDLIRALAQPITAVEAPLSVIDKTTFERRVVVSVEEPFNEDRESKVGPADRISKLRVTFKLPDDEPARFTSWNRFETRYETVDVGKLNLERSAGTEFSLSGGPKLDAQTPRSGTLGLKDARTLQEEINLRRRYIAMSGALNDKRVRIYEEGVMGIDLAGNFFLDIEISIKDPKINSRTVAVIDRLSDQNGNWLKPDKVKLRSAKFQYPVLDKPVKAEIFADYIWRHVTSGDKTIGENDDSVVFYSGQTKPRQVTLLAPSDLRAMLYRLIVDRPGKEPNKPARYELQLKGPKIEGPLYFASYGEAKAFLYWIKQNNNKTVGQSTLSIEGNPLQPKTIQELTVSSKPLNYKTVDKTNEAPDGTNKQIQQGQ